MIWVSILKRKPQSSGFYYWKGKSDFGGRAYYDAESGRFDFDESVPANKVDDEYLYWLDESEDEKSELQQPVVIRSFPDNVEIWKWWQTQKFQKEQGEQEYTMIYEIDLPRILKAFVERFQLLNR